MFSNNRAFVLGLTLTEVILMLFFVLLFTTDEEIDQLNEEKRELVLLQDSLASQLAVFQQVVTVDQSTLESLAESLPLREEVESLQQQLTIERERLNAIQAREDMDDEDFDRLTREAETVAVIERESRLQKNVEDLDSELAKLSSQLANCQAQNISCSNRLQGAGLGFPPCWANEQGRPEFIYVVTLRSDSLVVDRNWPVHRDQEARSMPGVLELADRTHSRSSFSRYALPILNWSKNQVPECRHFIIVDDSDGTSKEEYKRQLAHAENYFYKLLRN
jgi:hypothetical protein